MTLSCWLSRVLYSRFRIGVCSSLQSVLFLRILLIVSSLMPALVWPDTPPGLALEGQGYVPASTCEGCHQKAADAWADSDHAWAMRPATEKWVLGAFDDKIFNDGTVSARFFRRGGSYFVETEGDDGVPEEFRIAYTFGYFPLQQYLVQFPGGRLQAVTIAWDARNREDGGQRWFSLYPGERFAPDDALHWTGRYQNWNAMCADCHSTNLSMNYDSQADTFATTWHEQNVGCQGCHGPGQDHIKWADNQQGSASDKLSAKDMGLKLDFRAMDGEQVVEACAYCHSRRQALKDGHHAQESYLDKALPATLRPVLYHPDGQIQGEVYVYGSFTQSKMAAAGVDCLDCHNPHTTDLRVEGNGLCLQCHNASPSDRFPSLKAGNYATAAHHHHPLDSQGAMCVSCHMAEKTYMVVDPRRDHSFRIPRPDLTLTTGSPNACNDCHDDKTAEWAVAVIDDWFESPRRPQHFARALSAFRQEEDDAFIRLAGLIRNLDAPPIARATAGEHLIGFGAQAGSALRSGLLSNEPLVQAYASNSAAMLPTEVRVDWLQRQLAPDRPRAVRDQAIRALAGVDILEFPEENRARIESLKSDYEKRLHEMATLPGTRLNLAVYLHREGRYSEAIDHYQRALRTDGDFTPARVNLATLASEQDRTDLAIKVLVEGVDRKATPASDRGHMAYLLALVFVELGDLPEALVRFEQAELLSPENPRVAYNHGLVLVRIGRLDSAEQVLLNGLKTHSEDPGLLNAMVFLTMQQGRLSETLNWAKRLREASPNDPQAERLIRDLKTRLN
ncbi:tetratricopeptide repeat protein [Marinobacter adhaerens]|uniref:tetratricopeptide repeat protein n=1 Tax=Marinobacter adhaerens TaxID=1033846 RepID=UPI001E410684|nr:tetratricopeptide repeat protein [Marinobacter adhaerens]MCD1647342.1 tetratricopeptide repeat protein [Marinobacter adhaerens]